MTDATAVVFGPAAAASLADAASPGAARRADLAAVLAEHNTSFEELRAAHPHAFRFWNPKLVMATPCGDPAKADEAMDALVGALARHLTGSSKARLIVAGLAGGTTAGNQKFLSNGEMGIPPRNYPPGLRSVFVVQGGSFLLAAVFERLADWSGDDPEEIRRSWVPCVDGKMALACSRTKPPSTKADCQIFSVEILGSGDSSLLFFTRDGGSKLFTPEELHRTLNAMDARAERFAVSPRLCDRQEAAALRAMCALVRESLVFEFEYEKIDAIYHRGAMSKADVPLRSWRARDGKKLRVDWNCFGAGGAAGTDLWSTEDGGEGAQMRVGFSWFKFKVEGIDAYICLLLLLASLGMMAYDAHPQLIGQGIDYNRHGAWVKHGSAGSFAALAAQHAVRASATRRRVTCALIDTVAESVRAARVARSGRWTLRRTSRRRAASRCLLIPRRHTGSRCVMRGAVQRSQAASCLTNAVCYCSTRRMWWS